jgi:hypothetical protein
MIKKLVLCFSLLLTSYFSSNAQTDLDALRFSITGVQGTARNIALGNTMGTIGADFSALSSNPAGIAKFSSTEFTLSVGVSISQTDASYLNQSTSNSKARFQLTNAGIIVASRYTSEKANKNWNGLKFGIGINRIANYNTEYYFGGYNEKNSLIDHYWEKLSDRDIIQSEDDAKTKYPFDASIAYQLGLLTADSLGNIYTATNNGNMQQDIAIKRTGGMDELAIGFGSLYKEKIMIGTSIGIPIINYNERVRLKETDTRDSAFDLNSFTNETILKTSGAGFNLKFGIIAMPVKNLRLSLAIQTPGIIYMRDVYGTNMEVDYNSLSYILTGESPEGISKYKFVQPWKLTTGAGYIHKYGLVSLEYELTDAGSSKFRFNETDTDTKNYENSINSSIRKKYGMLHTIKGGVELKFDPVRIRGGIQYSTSPFKKDFSPEDIKTTSLTFSAGLGYRGKHFFADIAYQQTNFKELFTPYNLNTEAWKPVPTATLSTKRPVISLTLGYKL